MDRKNAKRKNNLIFLRDWIFERIVNFLAREGENIIIKKLKYSSDKNDRKCTGYVDYDNEKIYFDAERLTSTEIVHEFTHLIFGELLFDEADQQGAGANYSKRWNWDEDRTKEFTSFFLSSLTNRQVAVLQKFVDGFKAKRA